MKVRIEKVRVQYEYGDEYMSRVYVDDELIGIGTYGGEPEDNSIFRDYKWVPKLLVDLATKLGAEVERKSLTEKVSEDDNEAEDYNDPQYSQYLAASPTSYIDR